MFIVKNLGGNTPREVELMPVHKHCTWEKMLPYLRQEAAVNENTHRIAGIVIDETGIAIKVEAIEIPKRK